MYPIHRTLLCVILILSSCSKIKKEVNKENLHGEYIYRKEKESLFIPPPPLPKTKKNYHIGKKEMGGFFRITKDFFRCKGNPTNPLVIDIKDEKKVFIRDCMGGEKHGLPVRDGKEFIYPCLIDLLNYVQDKTKKKVIITTGHRCPAHNNYVDRFIKTSKHMIGAEVDFYVQGMEKEPEKVIALLRNYYKEKKEFEKEPAYTNFERQDSSNLTISPWMNKEIIISLHLEQEDRDFDNAHAYPYITLQVRYDRLNKTKVLFDEKLIHKYLRK